MGCQQDPLGSVTVLSHQSIKARCTGTSSLIDHPVPESIRSASYDLRIGSEYYLADYDNRRGAFSRVFPTPIGSLGPGRDKVLEIGPNEVVLLLAHERVQMPNDLVGHLSLKLDLLLKGLIMSSQSQVDAGYKGPIYALLYNLSDGPVTVRYLDPFLRLEFALLDAATARPYDGDYKPDFSLGDVVRGRIRSSLSDMENTVTETRRRVFQIAAGSAIAAAIAIASILGPVQGQASDASADARQAEDQVANQAEQLKQTQQELSRLETEGAELLEELERLRQELSPTPSPAPPTTVR